MEIYLLIVAGLVIFGSIVLLAVVPGLGLLAVVLGILAAVALVAWVFALGSGSLEHDARRGRRDRMRRRSDDTRSGTR